MQQFLDFDIDKYNLLILIYDNFTQKDIRIRNEFQYFIIMLCLAQYLVHIKKMIRNIKYRNLRVNDDDEQTFAE